MHPLTPSFVPHTDPLIPPPLAPPHPVHLVTLPEHDCSYLPGRRARTRALLASQMSCGTFRAFMAAGYRRIRGIVFQSVSTSCRAWMPSRVRFHPRETVA